MAKKPYTFDDYMSELGRSACEVVRRLMQDNHFTGSDSCTPLLRLNDQSWRDAVKVSLTRYPKNVQDEVAGQLIKYHYEYLMEIDRQNKQAEAEQKLAPYQAAVTVCETEYETLQEWKRNEPDPLDCHKNDHVLLALETVIRHFKAKG